MNANVKTMLVVAGGMAIFGGIIWAIKKLPASAVTTPVKDAANIATGG